MLSKITKLQIPKQENMDLKIEIKIKIKIEIKIKIKFKIKIIKSSNHQIKNQKSNQMNLLN